jgi:RNA polymerase sigma factor (sigma-70 family)
MSSSTLAAGLLHLRSQLAVQQRGGDSDEQLLHDFTTRRDESAFAVLLRRHGPMVLHVCRRVLGHEQDAEDAFQATFLVLARSAASLRNKTSLASWLYGTAYRTALKARQSAARRRKREDQTAARSPANPSEELLWREVRELLDEETALLPEKYRSVFVLCCLENLSQTEAAHRLGVKIRTVSNRLAEARKRLAQRLRRRGVELTAVLSATGLAAQTASALSPELMVTTLKAALATTAGQGLTGIVSASVANLVKSGTAAMVVNKTKIAVLVLLTLTLLGGAGAWAYRHSDTNALTLSVQPAGLSAGEEENKSGVVSPPRDEAKTVEIQGRVLGPDGKSRAGAKLLLLDENQKGKITQLGVTTADGRFTVAVPEQAKGRRLIAQTEGTGIDFLYAANLKPGKPVELGLVKDRPIRGQIISTEGKPVAGVRVAVRLIKVYANNLLDSFLIAWEKRRGNSEMPDGVKALWTEGATLLPFAATTDAEGRFVLRGVGSERVALLRFSGPGIASTERWIVNRDGFDAQPYNQDLRNYSPGKVLWGPWTWMSGPDVSIVAEREKIIRGFVKDVDTGKGVANAAVWLIASGTGNKRNDQFGGLLALPLETRADAEGRYEIRGVFKAKSYLLQVMKDRATGYLGCAVRLPDDTPRYQPFMADLTVKKGVIVTGKIIDKSTNKPVPGLIEYAVLNDNPFAKNYPTDSQGFVSHAETGNDGTFREVVIPGAVLLMASIDPTRLPGGEAEALGYKKCQPDPKYPQYFQARPDGDLGYLGLNGHPFAYGGNACKVVDTNPDTAIVHQNLSVERHSVRMVKVVDAEGRPVRSAWVTGIREKEWPIRLNSDVCPVYAGERGKPRLMVFYESSRKLAGTLTLKGNKKESAVAKLARVGAIRGRLLDPNGKPLTGVVVDVRYREEASRQVHNIVHAAKKALTDEQGTFLLDELIPEQKFELIFRHGTRRFEQQLKPDDPVVQVESGACHDLGAIKLKLVHGGKEE